MLDEFRIDKRREKEYHPHVTLSTTNELEKAMTLALQKFQPFQAKVTHIWIYNRDMKLVKDYFLEEN